MLHVFLWKSYFSVSKLDQLEQVLGVTVDMFGVTWTVPSWYRPPPAAQPTIFNRIPVFLPESKRAIQPPGSSWCGLPGSDNVCSRSRISKVNHPRLNYWHPSTDGGLNYDALNQTGVPCNYIHFTQLDSQLQSPACKISIPQTCQKTHLKDPLYHDLWIFLVQSSNKKPFSHNFFAIQFFCRQYISSSSLSVR